MKNLCFLCFCAQDKGGVNRIVTCLCDELLKSGNYKIHILSVCGSGNVCAYEVSSGIFVESVGADTSWRLRKIAMFSVWKIVNYLNRNNIDITFMQGHYIPIIAVFVKPFVRCKFVFCDHGALENQLEDKKATFFRKLACKFSDKVIVLTKSSEQAYERHFKISPESGKVEHIYNFLDDKVFEHASRCDIGSKKILSVGRVSPEKGYDMLVDVAKILLNKYPDWQWHIYGGGGNIDKLRADARSAGLEDKVIFKGDAGEGVYDVYKNYSIYVMTSYREGLPLVLLEAKANSLPIVSFDCLTGPSEIVRDGVDGYLIECYNKEKMADRLSELIEDSCLRREFSDRSGENLDRFGKNKIIKQWETLIDVL